MITKFTGEGLFFTSDTHFCHDKIIDYCKRPFKDIQEHDQALINNWNSVVGMDDTVFHLGDFCYGGFPKWQNIVKQLNGHIYLIRGNHDDKQASAGIINLFEDTCYQARIIVNGQTVYLNHFPFMCFAHGDPTMYGNNCSYQLFGHIHSGPYSTSKDTTRSRMLYPTQYDVGVDNNNYKPVSWKEVKDKIQQQILITNAQESS